MTVTNHMLRQKIAEINRKTRYIPVSSGSAATPTALAEEGTVLLSEKKIVAVQGDYMITEDGVKSKLYNPMPCLHWKCLVSPDSNGKMTLKKALTGLFVTDGADSYCLGVSGSSDEFEVRFQVGTNEVRLNNTFLNLNASHIVKNGLEE